MTGDVIMPRLPRVMSKTGIYHIMIRGINQQTIFQDIEDNEKFLDILNASKDASSFKLYGYCLMGNHVHLLIKTMDDDLGLIFKRIGARYVYWYNLKYKRSGHLFQDRFRSEPVCDDKYFLTVLRYIHRNPINASLCKMPDKYEWSSYKEYIGDACNTNIVDTDFVYSMIGIDELIKYTNLDSADVCLENSVRKAVISDADAKSIMMDLCNCRSMESFQKLNSHEKIKYSKTLNDEGISIRQLSRITGISKGIIERLIAK